MLRDAARALVGSEHEAKNLLGLSSLRIFRPAIGLPTWLGIRRADRRVPIYNFFNRVPAPRSAGYSVRVTYARDFRGEQKTYDGHLGTDFAVPVGTPIVAAAPGIVLRVANDWARGGLKVGIDHGEGLFATYNHLSRAAVRVGETVARGREIGLSGASGMEFVSCFPWVAPHLHFNTWLGGVPADPFARDGETALWRSGNDPVPFAGDGAEEEPRPSDFDAAGVDAAIAACRDPELRTRMRAIGPLEQRAAEVIFRQNYHSSAFDGFPPVYARPAVRRPVLDLPFPASFASGVVF